MEIFHLGQNIVYSDPQVASKEALKRDYPEIFNEGFGVIMIPEVFPSKSSLVVDPESVEDDKKFIEDLTKIGYNETMVKKYYEHFRKSKGDKVEKLCHVVLQEYFESKSPTDDVVIVNGLEIDKGNGGKQELDFLVANKTRRYFIHLEVKGWLGLTEGKDPKKSSVYKIQCQFDTVFQLCNKWFGQDIDLKQWKWYSVAFCRNVQDYLKDCSDTCPCHTFIAKGPDELLNTLKNIDLENLKNPELNIEFTKLCQILLYLMPKVALPHKGNILKEIRKMLNESGSYENVKIWAFRTPEQRRLCNHQEKLALIGPWGSGKTLMLISQALEMSEKEGKKVLFLLMNRQVASTSNTLLFWALQEKFKDHPNVTVKSLVVTNGQRHDFEKLMQGFDYVYIDEFFSDFDALEAETKTEFFDVIKAKKVVKIAMSNVYFKSKMSKDIDVKDYIGKWLPKEFQIAELKIPLRMPRNLSQKMKESFTDLSLKTDTQFLQRLMAESHVPLSLPDGRVLAKVGGLHMALDKAYQECFKKIQDDQSVLIVIADAANRTEIQAGKSLLDCECGAKLLVLTHDYGLEMADRKPPGYHCISHSDGELKVKKVISGEEDRDLVVTLDLARGYESEVVVDGDCLIQVPSRSCGQVVKMFFNKFLSMVCVAKAIKGQKDHHNCGEMFDREKRPKVNFDQGALISQRVDELGLCLHDTFTSPYGYFSDQNPILNCITDQLPKTYKTNSELLDEIIEALKCGKIQWKSEFSNLISQDIWMQKIKYSNIFYRNHANDIHQMNQFEDMLMDLCAQVLDRRILLLPFLPDESEKSFGTPNNEALKPIMLLGCVRPWFSNFFLSVTSR